MGVHVQQKLMYTDTEQIEQTEHIIIHVGIAGKAICLCLLDFYGIQFQSGTVQCNSQVRNWHRI